MKTDFEQYLPLMNTHGVIAFHDINSARHSEGVEVAKFWQEIKQNYAHKEIIRFDNDNEPSPGFGLLYLSPAE